MDKRLTYRTEDGWVGVNDQTNGVVSTNSQAVHRLADIEDIMEKIKNHEQGEYFYYSRWKYPRQEDIYQLVVEPEGSYLCHVNRQKYYEFEDMG